MNGVINKSFDEICLIFLKAIKLRPRFPKLMFIIAPLLDIGYSLVNYQFTILFPDSQNLLTLEDAGFDH